MKVVCSVDITRYRDGARQREGDIETYTWLSMTKSSFLGSFMVFLQRYSTRKAMLTGLPSSFVAGIEMVWRFWLEKSISRPPLTRLLA